MSSVKLLDWGEEGHRSQGEIASLRAAFAQEVAVWHKLDHPNVTKVIVCCLRCLVGCKFVPFFVFLLRCAVGKYEYRIEMLFLCELVRFLLWRILLFGILSQSSLDTFLV